MLFLQTIIAALFLIYCFRTTVENSNDLFSPTVTLLYSMSLLTGLNPIALDLLTSSSPIGSNQNFSAFPLIQGPSVFFTGALFFFFKSFYSFPVNKTWSSTVTQMAPNCTATTSTCQNHSNDLTRKYLNKLQVIENSAASSFISKCSFDWVWQTLKHQQNTI